MNVNNKVIYGLLLTYLLTYLLLLEKLTDLQLVKKFPAFHGTRRFITARTSVHHLSPSWAGPTQSIYQHPKSWRSILILSTNLRLGLHSVLFPSSTLSIFVLLLWFSLETWIISVNSAKLTYLLTYCMVQSPSWEANWFAASQEIPHISWNPTVHYCTYKCPPPVSILGQPNPVHIPTSHLLEIHPDIIYPSTPRSPQWSLDSKTPKMFVCFNKSHYLKLL